MKTLKELMESTKKMLPESTPQLDGLRILKNQWAVIDYEKRIKSLFIINGYIVNIGNYGLIFITPPANVGFTKSFDSIHLAYNHYSAFLNN